MAMSGRKVGTVAVSRSVPVGLGGDADRRELLGRLRERDLEPGQARQPPRRTATPDAARPCAGSGRPPPPPSRRRPRRASIAAARRLAWGMPAASTPRSKRCEASLRSPRRFEVRRTARGIEGRRLEQHRGGRRRDLALRAAHDAGERDPAALVGDDDVALLQRPIDAVERRHPLAASGAPDDDAAPQPVEVERVQRVPRLEHHVVGHVDEVGDRAHAARREAHAQRAAGSAPRAGR